MFPVSITQFLFISFDYLIISSFLSIYDGIVRVVHSLNMTKSISDTAGPFLKIDLNNLH